MWNEVCKKIFIEFADKLNDKGIRYFVLRNYKNLPEQNLGKDVDIVVDPKSVKDARQTNSQEKRTKILRRSNL